MTPMLITALQMALALMLDKWLGEAKRWHPLVGFGNLAHIVEKRLNRRQTSPTNQCLGVIGCIILVSPLVWLLASLQIWYATSISYLILETLILYFAIGQNSLSKHGMQIYTPLANHNIQQARHYVGYIVSRDTQQLNEQQITRATVESMLENGHDAVIASLFYFLIGGAPLVVLHRLVNTLDAMWGYKNPRYFSFGWCAAKLDDGLGFLSACCTSLLYVLSSKSLSRIGPMLRKSWQQSAEYKSKNGGLCMSSGAQVLGVKLGGSAMYHSKKVQGVTLGHGLPATTSSIKKSINLVKQSSTIFICFIAGLGLIQYGLSK